LLTKAGRGIFCARITGSSIGSGGRIIIKRKWATEGPRKVLAVKRSWDVLSIQKKKEAGEEAAFLLLGSELSLHVSLPDVSHLGHAL
jgi:hypothetical protein